VAPVVKEAKKDEKASWSEIQKTVGAIKESMD